MSYLFVLSGIERQFNKLFQLQKNFYLACMHRTVKCWKTRKNAKTPLIAKASTENSSIEKLLKILNQVN